MARKVPVLVVTNETLSQNLGLYSLHESLFRVGSERVDILAKNNKAIEFGDNSEFRIKFDGTKYGIEKKTKVNFVYLTDQENFKIKKFDSEGNFILEWGAEGVGTGQFTQLMDIAVDSESNVYAIDSDNSFTVARIHKFDADGNYILTFGSVGAPDGTGKMKRPTVLVSGPNDDIYVFSSSNPGTIVVFSKMGVWIREFVTKDDFGVGIILDSAGNIFTSENWAWFVKYNNAGVEQASVDILTVYGDPHPMGIGIDSSDKIYLTLRRTAQILIFDNSLSLLGELKANSMLKDADFDFYDNLWTTSLSAGAQDEGWFGVIAELTVDQIEKRNLTGELLFLFDSNHPRAIAINKNYTEQYVPVREDSSEYRRIFKRLNTNIIEMEALIKETIVNSHKETSIISFDNVKEATDKIGFVGSIQVDETNIADGRILVKKASGNLEYEDKPVGITQADFVVSNVSELDAALGSIPSTGASIACKAGTYDKGSYFLIPNISNIRIFSEGGAIFVRPHSAMTFRINNVAAFSNLTFDRLTLQGPTSIATAGTFPCIGMLSPTGGAHLSQWVVKNCFFSDNNYDFIDAIYNDTLIFNNLFFQAIDGYNVTCIGDSRGWCGGISIFNNRLNMVRSAIQMVRLGMNRAGATVFCGGTLIYNNYFRANTGVFQGTGQAKKVWLFLHSVANNVNSSIEVFSNAFHDDGDVSFDFCVGLNGSWLGSVYGNKLHVPSTSTKTDSHLTNAITSVPNFEAHNNVRFKNSHSYIL